MLAALAADHDEPLPWETLSTQTPSGGEHWYFTAPDGSRIKNSVGRLGWLLDVRASGGYVVAAGSVVRGRRYRSNDHDEVAALPTWLAALLQDSAVPRPELGSVLDIIGRRSQYAAAALRGELDRVLGAGRGSRNATLNKAAFALGQLVATGLLPDGLARSVLAEASAAVGLPAGEADRTIRSGLNAGARQPRSTRLGKDRS